MTKTLDHWQKEMSDLFDELRAERVKREDAAELTNICGKALKAESLKLGREMFEAEFGRKAGRPSLPNKSRAKQLVEAS